MKEYGFTAEAFSRAPKIERRMKERKTKAVNGVVTRVESWHVTQPRCMNIHVKKNKDAPGGAEGKLGAAVPSRGCWTDEDELPVNEGTPDTMASSARALGRGS